MQYVLSNAILRINQYVTEVNESNGMATPDLAASVCEKRANRPTRIHFQRLYDGVHPTLATRVKWAKKFQKAINANRHFQAPLFANEPIPSYSDEEDEVDDLV